MEFDNEVTDDVVLKEMGDRMARLRLNRNLTQEALAREAGVSKRTIHRIEHGHSAQVANWIRLLRAFGLLENLEALVPQPVMSPIQQVKMRGHDRKRASSPTVRPAGGEPWSWGDEE